MHTEQPLEEVTDRRGGVDTARKYLMLPVRLIVFLFAVLISLLLVILGHSWKNEWQQMDVRGYLLEGKNWNRAGF
jgi:hypothetical protein